MKDGIEDFRRAIAALHDSGVRGIEAIEKKFLALAGEMERASEQVRQIKIQWSAAAQAVSDAFEKIVKEEEERT